MKTRCVALFALFSLLVACSSDDTTPAGNNVNSGDTLTASSLTDVCAGLESLEGSTIRIRGVISKSTGGCTVAACVVDEPDAGVDAGTVFGECCNYCESTLGYDCADGTRIKLVRADDADFDPVVGEVVTDEVTEMLAEMVESREIGFGCTGQECYEVCTLPPEEEATLTGVLQLSTTSSTTPFYELVVSTLD